MPVRPSHVAMLTLAALLVPGAARADLSGEYVAWAELQAIMEHSEIPVLLGMVTRIEAIGSNTYRLQADGCHMTAAVQYESPKAEGYDVVLGPPAISGVALSEVVCE